MSSLGSSKDIEIKLQTLYLIQSFFKKEKSGLELVSLPRFLYTF